MSVKITTISEKSNGFLELYSESIRDYFPEYPLTAREYFVKDTSYKKDLFSGLFLFGAIMEKELVGFLITDNPFGGVISIRWLAVHKGHRHQSVGKELLAELEKESINAGIHLIQAEIDQRNLSFYEKKGFSIFGKYNQGFYGMKSYLVNKLIQQPLM